MGYCLTEKQFDHVISQWSEKYLIYAPKSISGAGAFSGTDVIRYETILTASEIEFQQKSNFSFSEVLLPLSQTLFYFTEEQIKEPEPRYQGAIIFLRSCDLHSLKRLDEVYLKNGQADYYYRQLRENTRFILMGCEQAFSNCFCVDLGTNHSDEYDAAIEHKNGFYYVNNCFNEWTSLLEEDYDSKLEVTPSFVTKTSTRVCIPKEFTPTIFKSAFWDSYDSRCINCGRCTFVCPTCTCFSMQDIFYTDNGKAGERRRVRASCMTDGFTDVAGGGSYRKSNGQRLRFRVLHKIYDYEKRFGYPMCTGCGRCDDACPEYISYSTCINGLEAAMKEVEKNET